MKKSKAKIWLLLAAAALCCAAFVWYVCMERRDEDRESPEISFTGDEIFLSVSSPEAALLEGVSAWDSRDGVVTGSLVVESVSSISADKAVTVTYAAFDRAGNVAKAQRTVRYTDYESPRFALSQPLVFAAGRYTDVMKLIAAEDAIDGPLTDKIKATLVGGEGSISEVGVHEVEFRVTNSMGETIYLTVPVEVYQTGAYNASLTLSENLLYLPKNAVFSPRDYLTGMTAAGREIPLDGGEAEVSVAIQSNVDTRTPGSYSVTYTVKSGPYTGYTRLMVVVEE